MPRKRKAKPKKIEIAGFVGIGLDNDDGHKRVTTGDNFLVAGGSEETHARLTEVIIEVSEAVARRGNCVRGCRELIALFREAHAKHSR